MRSLVPFVLLLSACAKNRDPAPEDMDGLVRWLFRHFEEPETLAEGMENLSVWLDETGRTEEASEGFTLSVMTEEDVADVAHPEDDLAEMIGVAVPGVSPYPIGDHAALLVLEDQVWNDIQTYELYVRTVTEGDVDAFAAGSGVIRTVNDIDKKGAFGVHIPYTLYKDYAWVPLDDDRTSIVGRSWIEEPACAEGGDNCLWQSFSIDLFFAPGGAGTAETIRMTASWNELETSADGVLTEDQRIGLMVEGIHDIFENTDELLAEETP